MANTLKLVFDDELQRRAAERGPTSAEAYVLLELREARSKGEKVFAFRNAGGRYILKPLSRPSRQKLKGR